MATTAAPAYQMIDPGERFGFTIERAADLIERAREWAPGSPQREIEGNSFGWNILRAYHGLRSRDLEMMTGEERYAELTDPDAPLRLVFSTPRPAWATHTDYYDLLNPEGSPDSMSCQHSRDSLSATGAYVAIQQFGGLDVSGEVVSTGPEVMVKVDRDSMAAYALVDLGKACIAAAEQLVWISRQAGA